MKIIRKNTASGSSLICEGDLTIYTVAVAKTELLNDYGNLRNPIALDLKKVNELDTAGVQLLLFIKKFLTDNNMQLYLKNSNEHVDGILNTFEVASQFILEK